MKMDEEDGDKWRWRMEMDVEYGDGWVSVKMEEVNEDEG